MNGGGIGVGVGGNCTLYTVHVGGITVWKGRKGRTGLGLGLVCRACFNYNIYGISSCFD